MGAALALELRREVLHGPFDGLFVQRAGLVFEDKAQGIGFFAFGQLVALVDVEQRNALEQLALRSERHVAQRREGHLLVHEQRQVALHLGELRQLLGHDLGHTPFGHAGEKALSSMLDKPFRHNEQSLRVVDKLERDGAGLNLTYEVRMGILGHTGDFIPETLEGQIVRTSDRIAYINHDIDDAMRAGILTEADIPAQIAEILGHSHSQRINTLVENMIENTLLTGTLGMQPDVAQAMDQLRTFMFARVYTNPVAKGEESKAKDMLCRLFEYYMKNPERLPPDFLPQLDFDGMERIVCDYIAGMTDRYAVHKYSELFIPATWQVR
jgi:dGTPase